MIRRGAGLSRSQAGLLLHPGYRSGAYYGMPNAGAITGAVVADTIYAFPIPLAQPMRVNFGAIRVAFGVAGVNGKMALYTNILADGRLIQEGDSAFSMATTGVMVGTFFTGNPSAPAGTLWVACKFDGAAQPSVVDHTSILNAPLFNLMGQSVAPPLILNASAIAGARRSDAYANAFPATFGAVTWTAGAPGAPVATVVAL